MICMYESSRNQSVCDCVYAYFQSAAVMAAGISGDPADSVYLVASTSGSVWHNWLSWTYAGVDPKLPGNGGSECFQFLSPSQKLIETVFYVSVAVFAICYSWPRLTVGERKDATAAAAGDSVGRRLMLVVMCLTFGVEIGFKLATRQLIWILNPCHLVTMMQVGCAVLIWHPSRVTK